MKIDAVYLSGRGGKLKCCWEITQVRNLPEFEKTGGGVTFVIRSFLAVPEFSSVRQRCGKRVLLILKVTCAN